ncbi:MAG: hypothetical protein Q7T20_04525 [Saprospiraceae bacterium]|nr:hypothetical protein [Saprospiraceae bacterium]
MLRNLLSYWPLLVLSLWSCRKDVQGFYPYAPSAQDLGNLLSEKVPNASTHSTFTFSFLANDITLETPSGARVFLVDTDHLFSNVGSGQPLLCSTCPDLKIEITEVLDKGDILARGLNTIGDSGTLFESGGMVRVTASCSGQQLALLPGRTMKIQIPNKNQQNGFFVFNKIPSTTGQGWISSNQKVFKAEWPLGNGIQLGYEVLAENLGWVACGRPVTDPSSLFCVELPSGFADQNTLAYVVFKDQQIVAPLQFALGQNKFCYPKTPAGFQVQLVAVSKLGDQFWLGKAETEVGTNTTFPLSTQQLTETALLNFVKGL